MVNEKVRVMKMAKSNTMLLRRTGACVKQADDSVPGIGDQGWEARVKNARVLGQCSYCGGVVKLVMEGRHKDVREAVCLQCGIVNPPIKRQRIDDREVVRVMGEVFDVLTSRLQTDELEPAAFAAAVEWALGQSLGRLWRMKGRRWLEEAGLEVTPWGMVRRKRDQAEC